MSMITVRLTAESHLELKRQAALRQMSLNAWCLRRLSTDCQSEAPPTTDLLQRRLVELGFKVSEVCAIATMTSEHQRLFLRAIDETKLQTRQRFFEEAPDSVPPPAEGISAPQSVALWTSDHDPSQSSGRR